MAESEEELKSLLMRVKEESEKTDLKRSTQKTKILASGPITSWQIEREKEEAVTDFMFLGPKITVDSDCSHEIKNKNKNKKQHLLLGRKYMNKPRQWHHFADKGPNSQSYGFSSSMDVRVGPWRRLRAEEFEL